MKKFTKKTLLEHLNKSEKEDIVNEIITLFEKFDNVKEFYRSELSDTSNPILETYKKKITKAYLLPNPKERSTNMNVNKLIIAFKKINLYKDELVDLNLYRVECGIKAFSRNGDRTETFYNCIFKSFEEALNTIVAENYMDEYQQRISTVVKNANGGKFEIKKRMEQLVSDTI